jgi:hypothetical protein
MSGAALTLTAVAAMVLGCAGLGAVGQVARAHAEVDAVADLAALAVATRTTRGETADRACGGGDAVARAAGARLVHCTVGGGGRIGAGLGPGATVVPVATVGPGTAVVTVSTEVDVWGLRASVTGTARAGPVPGPGP